MKKILFTLFTLLIFAIMMMLVEIHGFRRGYEQGRREVNTWWIDQKSRLYDTSERLKNDALNGHNQI